MKANKILLVNSQGIQSLGEYQKRYMHKAIFEKKNKTKQNKIHKRKQNIMGTCLVNRSLNILIKVNYTTRKKDRDDLKTW